GAELGRRHRADRLAVVGEAVVAQGGRHDPHAAVAPARVAQGHTGEAEADLLVERGKARPVEEGLQIQVGAPKDTAEGHGGTYYTPTATDISPGLHAEFTCARQARQRGGWEDVQSALPGGGRDAPRTGRKGDGT